MNARTLKTVETKMGSVERGFKNLKRYSILISIVLGVVSAIYLFFMVSDWFDTHQIVRQSPLIIKVQSPILIKERKPSKLIKVKAIKLEGSNENGEVTAGLSQGEIAYEAYKTVKFRESSNGKDVGLNKYCKDRGMINEVGYDPQNKFCFKDLTEQVSTITNWFRNCLEGDKIDACLEKYSGGSYNELGYEIL